MQANEAWYGAVRLQAGSYSNGVLVNDHCVIQPDKPHTDNE